MGIQHWYPDTCLGATPCKIRLVKNAFDFDDVERLCPHHAALHGGKTKREQFDAILERCRTKNRVITLAQSEMGIVEQADGTKAIPPWRVDTTDIVRVTTGLNSTRRTRLQNAINAAVGSGKAVVE